MKPIAQAENLALQEIKKLPQAQKELRRLREATRDVEAMFLKILVRELRQDAGAWIFQKTLQAEIYSDFLSEAVAVQVARGGSGMGLGDLLYKQLEPTILKRIAAEITLHHRTENYKPQILSPSETKEGKTR
ncbi:MAG: rod-binding protein [Candidatus Caldarchaeum sp.]